MEDFPSLLSADNRELLDWTLAFLLSMSRFSGFLAISPFFSRRSMPQIVRFGVILAASFPIVPGLAGEIAAHVAKEQGAFPSYPLMIVKELALGLFLGALTWLPVRGLELAGAILDTQRGATQGEEFDVVFSSQTTPTAVFLSQLFAGYFFSAGLFLMVLNLLYQSLSIWPPMEPFPPITRETMTLFIRFAGTVYFTAMVLVLPIAGFMLLSDICIAFLARSAPTLNALTLGMPVKSAVLMIMLIFYIGVVYPDTGETLITSLQMLKQVLTP